LRLKRLAPRLNRVAGNQSLAQKPKLLCHGNEITGQGQLNEVKGKLKQKYGQLTDDDFVR
jgi:hypothetical protein